MREARTDVHRCLSSRCSSSETASSSPTWCTRCARTQPTTSRRPGASWTSCPSTQSLLTWCAHHFTSNAHPLILVQCEPGLIVKEAWGFGVCLCVPYSQSVHDGSSPVYRVVIPIVTALSVPMSTRLFLVRCPSTLQQELPLHA